MALYSAEELELLQSDPDLVDLRAALQMQRDAATAAEAAELLRQRQLDHAIEQPLEELRSRGAGWNAWSSYWSDFRAREDAEQVAFEQLAERLLWIDDDEIGARLKTLDEEQQAFDAVLELEAQKRRYLVESGAWVEDWERAYAQQWEAARQDAVVVKAESVVDRKALQAAEEERLLAELKNRAKGIMQK